MQHKSGTALNWRDNLSLKEKYWSYKVLNTPAYYDVAYYDALAHNMPDILSNNSGMSSKLWAKVNSEEMSISHMLELMAQQCQVA